MDSSVLEAFIVSRGWFLLQLALIALLIGWGNYWRTRAVKAERADPEARRRLESLARTYGGGRSDG
jgi:hypothetical protein